MADNKYDNFNSGPLSWLLTGGVLAGAGVGASALYKYRKSSMSPLKNDNTVNKEFKNIIEKNMADNFAGFHGFKPKRPRTLGILDTVPVQKGFVEVLATPYKDLSSTFYADKIASGQKSINSFIKGLNIKSNVPFNSTAEFFDRMPKLIGGYTTEQAYDMFRKASAGMERRVIDTETLFNPLTKQWDLAEFRQFGFKSGQLNANKILAEDPMLKDIKGFNMLPDAIGGLEHKFRSVTSGKKAGWKYLSKMSSEELESLTQLTKYSKSGLNTQFLGYARQKSRKGIKAEQWQELYGQISESFENIKALKSTVEKTGEATFNGHLILGKEKAVEYLNNFSNTASAGIKKSELRLVGHNVEYDLNALSKYVNPDVMSVLRSGADDTLSMSQVGMYASREKIDGSFQLGDLLSRRFNTVISPHKVEEDVLGTAHLYDKLLDKYNTSVLNQNRTKLQQNTLLLSTNKVVSNLPKNDANIFSITSGNLYKVRELQQVQSANATKYLATFEQTFSGKQSVKTTHHMFDTMEAFNDFIGSNFKKVTPFEGRALSAAQGRAKAIDLISNAFAIGAEKHTASMDKYNTIKSIIGGTYKSSPKTSATYIDAMVNNKDFVSSLQSFMGGSHGKVYSAMFNQYGDRAERMIPNINRQIFANNNVYKSLSDIFNTRDATTELGRVSVPSGLGNGIRTSNLNEASKDINTILGKIVKTSGGRLSTGEAARVFLGFDQDPNVIGGIASQVFVPGSISGLNKKILQDIGPDTSMSGTIIAQVMMDSSTKLMKKPHEMLPEFNEDMKTIFAKNFRKAYRNAKEGFHVINDVDALKKLLKPMVVPENLYDVYKGAFSSDLQHISESVIGLQNKLESQLGENAVSWRLLKGSKEIQFGIFAEPGADAMRAFHSGANEIKSKYNSSINTLDKFSIPIPSAEGVSVNGRGMYNYAFKQIPGVDDPRQKNKEFFNVADVFLENFDSDKYVNGLTKKHKDVKELVNKMRDGDMSVMNEFVEKRRLLETHTSKRMNNIKEYMAASNNQEWHKFYNIEDSNVRSSYGNVLDHLNNFIVKDMSISDKYGKEKSDAFTEMIRATKSFANRFENFERGNINAYDLNAMHPLADLDGAMSPRRTQSLRSKILEVSDQSMSFVTTEAKTNVLNEISNMYNPQQNTKLTTDIPMFGIKAEVTDELFKHLKANEKIEMPTLTTMEGRMIVSSDVISRVKVKEESDLIVARVLTDFIYGKKLKVGDTVKHGQVFGTGINGEDIVYNNPFGESFEHHKRYLKDMGLSEEYINKNYVAKIKGITNVEGGTKYTIGLERGLIAGDAMFVGPAKNTISMMPTSLDGYMFGGNYIMSPREYAKSSRQNVGAMFQEQASIAVMAVRNPSHPLFKHTGMSASEIEEAGKSAINIISPGESILHVKKNPLSLGKTLDDYEGVAKKLEGNKLFGMFEFEHNGFKLQGRLSADDAMISDTLHVSKFHSAGLGGREIQNFMDEGKMGLVKELLGGLDPQKVQEMQEYTKAFKSMMSGETSPNALNLSEFAEPARHSEGGYAKTAGSIELAELLKDEGRFIKLPGVGSFDANAKYGASALTRDIREVSQVYIPKLSPYETDKASFDKWLGFLSKIKKGEDPTALTEQYTRMVYDNMAGKNSVFSQALDSVNEKSAVLQFAPNVAEANTTYMHPATAAEMMGAKEWQLDAFMKAFKDKTGEDFSIMSHRYPTTYGGATQVSSLRINRNVEPGSGAFGGGIAAAQTGDYDQDIAKVIDAIGTDNRFDKWSREADKVNKEKYASQMVDEYINSPAYKDIKSLQNRSSATISQLHNERISDYQKPFNPTTHEVIQNVHESKLNHLQSLMSDEHINMTGVNKSGTKIWAGETHNITVGSINELARLTYGHSSDAKAIEEMNFVKGFSRGMQQSTLSTKKTTTPPIEKLLELFSETGKSAEEMSSSFRSILGDAGLLDDFVRQAGSAVAVTSDKRDFTQLGEQSIDRTFAMLSKHDISAMDYKRSAEAKAVWGSAESLYKNGQQTLSFNDLMGLQGDSNVIGGLRNIAMEKENTIAEVTEVATRNIKLRGGKLALGAALTAGAAVGLYGLFNAVRPSPHSDTSYSDNVMPSDGIGSQIKSAITGKHQPTYEKMYVDVHAKSKRNVDNLNGYTQNAINGAMPFRLEGNININDRRANVDELVQNSFGGLFE